MAQSNPASWTDRLAFKQFGPLYQESIWGLPKSHRPENTLMEEIPDGLYSESEASGND